MDLALDDTGGSGGIENGGAPSEAAIADVAFLTRSVHRTRALVALAERPRSRSDLRETTGVSASTIGRMLGEFQRRHWIRRDGHQYEATQLGAFVAAAMRELTRQVAIEQKLRDVWQWLPTEVDGFTVEMCSDAVVSVAETADPYRPVRRFVSLLAETDRFRFVGSDLALIEPCKDEFRQRVLDGVRTEIIDPPSVARHVLSAYPDHCADPLKSGNLTIRVHDDVPSYGLGLFDDRIGIVGYSTDSGTVQVLIDTDAAAARDWAESTYERYRSEASPLSLTLAA